MAGSIFTVPYGYLNETKKMVFEDSCEEEMKHIISEICFLDERHQEGLVGI